MQYKITSNKLINKSLPYNQINDYHISNVSDSVNILVTSNYFLFDLVNYFLGDIVKGSCTYLTPKTKRFCSQSQGYIFITEIENKI